MLWCRLFHQNGTFVSPPQSEYVLVGRWNRIFCEKRAVGGPFMNQSEKFQRLEKTEISVLSQPSICYFLSMARNGPFSGTKGPKMGHSLFNAHPEGAMRQMIRAHQVDNPIVRREKGPLGCQWGGPCQPTALGLWRPNKKIKDPVGLPEAKFIPQLTFIFWWWPPPNPLSHFLLYLGVIFHWYVPRTHIYGFL